MTVYILMAWILMFLFTYFLQFLDINECRQYSGRLCAHKCENVVGSFHCSCATGFKLAHDGRNCEGTLPLISLAMEILSSF